MAEQLIHLGTDIDDTLVHSAPLTLETINAQRGTQLELLHWYQEPFDTVAWTAPQPETWAWVNAILHSQEFIEAVQKVEGADAVMRRVLELEQGLSASTGRPEKIEGNREFTLALLDHHYEGFFSNARLFFTDFFGQAGHRGSKADVAVAEGFTHTVDNQGKHAGEIGEAGMVSFILDRVWNQGYEHPKVIRADWDGIGEILERHFAILASTDPADRARVLAELQSGGQ